MLELASPWALGALLAPALAACARRAPRHRCGTFVPFFDEARGWSGRARVVRTRTWLALAGFLALTLAAARPQWIGPPVAVDTSGRDILVAMDVSGSMGRGDMLLDGAELSRLAAAKRVVGEFVARRAGDRIGLIVFGSRAYVHVPLTFDRTMVRTLVEETWVGLAGRRTAIGDAIALGVKRLADRPTRSRVLVLLTDGANTGGRFAPLDAAWLAARRALRVHVVGIGTPGDEGHGEALDEPTLRAVAQHTGGRYFRARDGRSLRGIYRAIDALEPVVSDAEIVRPVQELFHWPLAAALALGCLAGLAPGARDG